MFSMLPPRITRLYLAGGDDVLLPRQATNRIRPNLVEATVGAALSGNIEQHLPSFPMLCPQPPGVEKLPTCRRTLVSTRFVDESRKDRQQHLRAGPYDTWSDRPTPAKIGEERYRVSIGSDALTPVEP
jgi:hypothetical protein